MKKRENKAASPAVGARQGGRTFDRAGQCGGRGGNLQAVRQDGGPWQWALGMVGIMVPVTVVRAARMILRKPAGRCKHFPATGSAFQLWFGGGNSGGNSGTLSGLLYLPHAPLFPFVHGPPSVWFHRFPAFLSVSRKRFAVHDRLRSALFPRFAAFLSVTELPSGRIHRFAPLSSASRCTQQPFHPFPSVPCLSTYCAKGAPSRWDQHPDEWIRIPQSGRAAQLLGRALSFEYEKSRCDVASTVVKNPSRRIFSLVAFPLASCQIRTTSSSHQGQPSWKRLPVVSGNQQ